MFDYNNEDRDIISMLEDLVWTISSEMEEHSTLKSVTEVRHIYRFVWKISCAIRELANDGLIFDFDNIFDRIKSGVLSDIYEFQEEIEVVKNKVQYIQDSPEFLDGLYDSDADLIEPVQASGQGDYSLCWDNSYRLPPVHINEERAKRLLFKKCQNCGEYNIFKIEAKLVCTGCENLLRQLSFMEKSECTVLKTRDKEREFLLRHKCGFEFTHSYDNPYMPECRSCLHRAIELERIEREKQIKLIIDGVIEGELTEEEKSKLQTKFREQCSAYGFAPSTYRFLARNNIYSLESLQRYSLEDFIAFRWFSTLRFKNLIETLFNAGISFKDSHFEDFASAADYLIAIESNYLEKRESCLYNKGQERCKIESFEELGLLDNISKTLVSKGIKKPSELLGCTRHVLKYDIGINEFDINEIAYTLYKHSLMLKGEEEYSCDMCDEYFVQSIDFETTHYCPSCKRKKERLGKIKLLEVSLSDVEYSSYTNGMKGFHILCNIKNTTETFLKVSFVDFYIVTQGRQFSPKYDLTGYSFDKATLFPNSLKSAAKIWNLNEINAEELSDGDEAYVVLNLPDKKKQFMFKFKYNDENSWALDDFFEDEH